MEPWADAVLRLVSGWKENVMGIRVKRAYEPETPEDGYRVLVDRLWPRGLSKERARVDLWLREVAPSTELRKWFAHDPGKWEAFRERYRRELAEHSDLLSQLRTLERREGTVTLLFGARDETHNQAQVLAEVLGDSSSRADP
jgi:uncharacterized protein YeaO (DUF488 family)